MNKPFWKYKKISEFTPAEWEALCDGCARCCLEKLEDYDTGEVLYTRVACKILDLTSCRCSHYSSRREYIPECLPVTPENKKMFSWLPSTCAYRLIYEGKELPGWHYLICGSRLTVHEQGYSVKNLAIPQVEDMDLEEYVIGEL